MRSTNSGTKAVGNAMRTNDSRPRRSLGGPFFGKIQSNCLGSCVGAICLLFSSSNVDDGTLVKDWLRSCINTCEARLCEYTQALCSRGYKVEYHCDDEIA